MPHSSLSYIWQVTGCQHSLQPTDNEYAPPCIPALTLRGFSRWESLEILLEPEEHVAYLQFAVKNWALKHPDTGESFPAELPRAVFPAESDKDVDLWHKSCSEQLNHEAAAGAYNRRHAPPEPPSDQQPNPEPKVTYAHVRSPYAEAPPRQRTRPGDPDYFPPQFSYVQGPPRPYPGRHEHRSTGLSPDDSRRGSLSDERDYARRKSFSAFPSPSPELPNNFQPPTPNLDARLRPADQPRRHSHPRHYASNSSDDDPAAPRMKRRHHPASPPPPSGRFVSAEAAQSKSTASKPSLRSHRADLRQEETRRRSPIGSLRQKVNETVNSLFPPSNKPPAPQDRPRSSRQNSYSEAVRPRRTREPVQQTRLSRSWSDLESEGDSGESAESEEDPRRRQKMRDRPRERGRPRDVERERELDRERDGPRDFSGSRQDRPPLRRPQPTRRTSSHADIDRRRDRPSWDARDRDRVRDDRRKGDRRAMEERDMSPTMGPGRRYGSPA